MIWIGGGPGTSSISSAVNEVGPCKVNADSNSTTLNPWSFNNEANLLFIDQPSLVGFSYDERVNGSISFATENSGLSVAMVITPETEAPLPQPNITTGVGTFASQNLNNTANSTANAAQIFWQSIQTWTQAFPQYVPKNKKLNLFSESYGGRYGPEFLHTFYEKNKQIQAGEICEAIAFEFDSFGIINGWLEPVLHLMSYPVFAVNNTYGVQMVNSTILAAMESNLTSPGGCLDLASQCQTAAAAVDPLDTGKNETIDGLCFNALQQCEAGVQAVPPLVSGLTVDDIAQPGPGTVLTPYYIGFFAQAWVQEALGAAVNFTDNSGPILAAFSLTGDLVRRGQLDHVAELLDAGVQVAIINGDLDYQINWFGGEAASLQVPWQNMDAFKNAGYANITTNETYVGGLVRQAGRLSFSRVFQAGHQGPSYQPETYFKIMDRTLKHLDVAEGTQSMNTNGSWILASVGPKNVLNVTVPAPAPAKPLCYQLEASLACDERQLEQIFDGTAVFKDYILQE